MSTIKPCTWCVHAGGMGAGLGHVAGRGLVAVPAVNGFAVDQVRRSPCRVSVPGQVMWLPFQLGRAGQQLRS
ncbi:hypothetical protein [Rhodoferax sp.]|uniref:hypothetical protein n=1 Tax=Rhodoferax sp. TaxID=50421 RepID=UPI00272162CD|nr:hypothetical protein [Rhodoferax sp.]MDO8319078.1 hypothetical protein [Rhodoferax sp.]